MRRRQRGLLLVTAHSAKGLEFDHVVVLDGGWQDTGEGEDADAPRRLYYVAMTRARKTLALVRLQEGRGGAFTEGAESGSIRRTPRIGEERATYVTQPHPLPTALARKAGALRRESAALQHAATALRTRHQRLGMKDVDLGFAGRQNARHPLHRAIADLAPGDPLTLRRNGARWELFNHANARVGRLAKSFASPDGMSRQSATVLAVVAWSRDRSDPEYQDSVKCDSWEVVVPEVRFAP